MERWFRTATERVSVTGWRVSSPEGGERNRGKESSLGAYGKTDDDEESRDDVGSVRFRRMANLKGWAEDA
jgi:hypothetical protein